MIIRLKGGYSIMTRKLPRKKKKKKFGTRRNRSELVLNMISYYSKLKY